MAEADAKAVVGLNQKHGRDNKDKIELFEFDDKLWRLIASDLKLPVPPKKKFF